MKELYVQENTLDLAKADAETLPAVQIGKVITINLILINPNVKIKLINY